MKNAASFGVSLFPRINLTHFTALLVLLVLLAFCGTPAARPSPADDFVTTWKTDNPGTSNATSITVPMIGGPYEVDWDNDGVFDESGLSGSVTHGYRFASTYTIRIRGTYDSIRFDNGGDKEKILSVEQWGKNSWTTMLNAFYGAVNLIVKTADTPDFSAVTDMEQMFRGATSANPDTSGWDTSAVTDMRGMFSVATSANPDTSGWDTSAVTDMSGMFAAATSADPDTSGWDTSAVKDMSGIFSGATSANPDTSGWDTSAVTDMAAMFSYAPSANPDTSGWDTSSVTSMHKMFSYAPSANPDTSGWDTSSVTDMGRMFEGATSFDRDIGSWDVTSLKDASDMFHKVSLSSANYENLLVGWNAQALQRSVVFSGGNSTYCSDAAAAARANMDSSDWWVITDGGLLCNFVTTWKTDNPGTSNATSITVPMIGGPYEVDWDNDGIFDQSPLYGSVTHDFGSAGIYTITVRGGYDSIRFANGGDKEKILSVDQWGPRRWTTMYGAFRGAANLIVNSGDTPDFSEVTDMEQMFMGAASANPDTSGWDTSKVKNMGDMFVGATSANPDTSGWDTSEVTDMSFMFAGATSANPVTSGWDISGITDMRGMFSGATSATPDTSGWDTSAVIDMSFMFSGATSANPDTSNWDTSIVEGMVGMFQDATSANPNTSNWDTSKVTNMGNMFAGATSATPDTSGWDTSAVTDMRYMFSGATSANPNTSGWDTSEVTDVSFLFNGATLANPDTSVWDTSLVTNMDGMFQRATSANPDTSWNTSAVKTMDSMFSGAILANPDTSGWDTSKVTDMGFMFDGATSANPDTSGWDTSVVTDMEYMFRGATSFDRDIGSWDVAALEDASGMFSGTALSIANYENLLVGWNSQALQPVVTFSGGNSSYCSDTATAARANMISSYSWVITDGGQACPTDFVTTWKTDNPGTSNATSITVPMIGGPYEVDWDNDGVFDQPSLYGPVTHDFGSAGTYTIRIRGTFVSIRFANGGDKEKIIFLDQWGENSWTNMFRAFHGAVNLIVNSVDTPDFSEVTIMGYMFAGATSANPDTSGWDTSVVTDMSFMFAGATSATPDTSGWDTSKVTDMRHMFNGATSANPNTSVWNIPRVTDMSFMFAGATSANPDTSGWDTSEVETMANMFSNTTLANPNSSGWDTSKVTDMGFMFSGAISANPDTSVWDTSAVLNMGSMFSGATSATSDTSGWKTSAVTDMSFMFAGATSANPDTSGWDTSIVTSMEGMFAGATSATPDTRGWDISGVTDMRGMFSGATSANPDTSGWDTSTVTNMSFMFAGATSFDRDIGSWDVAELTDASEMFSGVTLSTANYDSLLVGWNAQALQLGVAFNGGYSNYCSASAAAARANMISSDSWMITDGGSACAPIETCNLNTVSGVTEFLDVTHEACEVLVVGPDFIAADGANISVNSGWEVGFLPGFIVEQGATLNTNVCGQSLCMTSDTPMPYGCHSCVDQICDVDPSCCSTEFDQVCLDKVDSVCGLVCE